MVLTTLSTSAIDTLYVRQTDTIVIREIRYKKIPVPAVETTPAAKETTGKEGCEDNVFFVYFPLGHYGLDNEAQIAVQQMAARLEEHPQMSVRLTGYCDYVGSAELNDRLSVARAKTVGRQLAQVHGISENRILVEGKGRLDNVQAQYGPNRRVEMRLVKGDMPSPAPSGDQPVAAESPALKLPAGQNPPPKQGVSSPAPSGEGRGEASEEIRLLAAITVTPNMTLAQLARKYYGNPFCWVYIYAMNKSLIPNPNVLAVGKQLRVPELGEVDKQITKQESEEYYQLLRK